MRQVIEAVKAFMKKELGLDVTVISVEAVPEGWVAQAEVVKVDSYMRKFARKDLVETFEIRLNSKREVQSFARKGMRERGSVPE